MVPEMMANRRVGSVFTSSIFTIGLIIIILVLLFNYSTLLNRNSEAIREAHKLRLELQHATLSNNDSVKKLEACKADVSTVETKTKKLENDMKKQETMLSDLREQIKQSRKLFDAAVEDKNGLSRRISDLENAKKNVMNDMEQEKTKCQENAKTMAKECIEVCDKKIGEAKNEAEESCQQRIKQAIAVPIPAAVATNTTHK